MRRAGRRLLIAVVAIAVAASAVFSRYRQDLDRTHAAVQRGGQMIDTVAGPIEYAEREAGIPLLSIHGAGGGYDQGLANATDLVGEGFRVIAPSRFGYLRTPLPPDVSPAAQADALAALLSKLDVASAIVVGVSAGARSAIEMAIRHPDRVAALILIVPGTYAPASPVSVEASRGSQFVFWVVNYGADFAWWAAERIAPSMLIRFIGVRPGLVAALPGNEQQRVMKIVNSIQPLSLRFPGINVDSTVELRQLPLERIAAPTLIVSAQDDLFNTRPAAEHAASQIHDAKLIVYETGGHLLVGHEKETRDAVHAFLVRAGLLSQPNATGSAHR